MGDDPLHPDDDDAHTGPWKMPYAQVPHAPQPLQLPRPVRSKVSEVKNASGATTVVLDEADARLLTKYLARSSPWLKSGLKRPREYKERTEPQPPTEPAKQLEEWLNQFKTNEKEVLEHAVSVSNFFAWYYAVFKPPQGQEAKEAYDWMLEQMAGLRDDPTAPDLSHPSAAQIMRDYDKWMEVYSALKFDAL